MSLSLPLLVLAAATSSVQPHGPVERLLDLTVTGVTRPADGADPAAVACAPAGPKGRGVWLDERRWLYVFEAPVPKATRCEVREAGGRIVGTAETPGPVVETIDPQGPGTPENPSTIREDQVFVLRLGAAVDRASVEKLARFEVGPKRETVGVTLRDGADANLLLDYILAGRDYPQRSRLLLLAPQKPFPAGSAVRLVWPKGIAATSGVATVYEQDWRFVVRPAFEAELGPGFWAIYMNAPVARERVEQIRVLGPSGTVPTTVGEADRLGRVQTLELPRDLPAGTYTITWPFAFTDADGRAPRDGGLPDKFVVEPRDQGPRIGLPDDKIQRAAAQPLPVGLQNVKGATAQWARLPSDPAALLKAWDEPRVKGPFDVTEPLGDVGTAERRLLPPRAAGLEAVRVGARGSVPPAVATVLTTDLAAHLQWGEERSIVWVTRLSSGTPVDGASVDVLDCRKRRITGGVTNADGILELRDLPPQARVAQCGKSHEDDKNGVHVFARLGDDVAFFHSSWRTPVYGSSRSAHALAHLRIDVRSVADRVFLEPGDRVRMKLFARMEVLDGLAIPPAASLPDAVKFDGPLEDAEPIAITWSDHGTAEVTWKVPADAPLGRYTLECAAERATCATTSFKGGHVRVGAIRLPTSEATVTLPEGVIVAGDPVSATVQVRFLAGGSASGMPVDVAFRMTEGDGWSEPPDRSLSFDLGRPAVEPRIERNTQTYLEAYRQPDDEQPDVLSSFGEEKKAQEIVVKGFTDATGKLTVAMPMGMRLDAAGELAVSATFRDAGGAMRIAGDTRRVLGAGLRIGIGERIATGGARRLEVLVTGSDGKPAPGRSVRIERWRREERVVARELIGGYTGQDTHDGFVTATPVPVCVVETDREGRARCDAGTLEKDDLWSYLAEVMDDRGRIAGTHTWVSGQTYDTDRSLPPSQRAWYSERIAHLELTADKTRYEAGETAMLDVALPFEKGSLLVTLQREGVASARVVPITGRRMHVPVPVTAAWTPSMRIAVLAIGARDALVEEHATPLLLHGSVDVEVGDAAHRLGLTVAPERPVVRPGEDVTLTFDVRSPDGTPLGSLGDELELAVSVVDEALLQLEENDAWETLSFWDWRMQATESASSVGGLLGRAPLSLDALLGFDVAVPPSDPVHSGGLGGAAARSGFIPLRRFFDPVVHWQPRVPVGADGKARITFKANDAESRFHVEALVTAGATKLGHATASYRSAREILVFPGVPPALRGGDAATAQLTVKSLVADARTAMATHATPADAPEKTATQPLAAGAVAVFSFPFEAPHAGATLAHRFSLNAGSFGDRVEVVQKVEPAWPLRAVAAGRARLDKPLPMALPDGVDPEGAQVEVTLARGLTGALAGAERYMAAYPHACLEQLVSIAATTKDPAAWRTVTGDLSDHAAEGGFYAFFPGGRGDDALTAYVLTMLQRHDVAVTNEEVEPALTALRKFAEKDWRALAFGGISGREIMERRLAAAAAVVRWPGGHPFDAASLLPRDDAEARALSTSALLDAATIARLTASKTRPTVARALASRTRFEPSFMQSEATLRARYLDELVLSRQTAAASAAALTLVQLQQDGHWGLTTANAWAATALRTLAGSAPVSGTTTLAGQRHTWTPKDDRIHWLLPLRDLPAGAALAHTSGAAPWAFWRLVAPSRTARPSSPADEISLVKTIRRERTGPVVPGEVFHVRVEIRARTPQRWLVLDDPLPASATVVDGSTSDADHVAVSHTGVRAYFESMAAGATRAHEYRFRAPLAGRYQLPPSRVEAMYAPEIHAETGNEVVTVAGQN